MLLYKGSSKPVGVTRLNFLRLFLSILLVLIGPAVVKSQGISDAGSGDSLRALAPRVYIDCYDCWEDDYDYFRTEINFINFVRDRLEADIHIIITTQATGGAGMEVTIEFHGQQKYEGISDTLKCYLEASDTDEMQRSRVTGIMKMGLLRYMARTPLAAQISVNYSQPTKPAEVVDKWNYWVFQTSIDAWIQGQKSYRQFYDNVSLSVERTTDANKLDMTGWLNYNETRYTTDDYNSLNISRGKGTDLMYVWSLSPHWSLGGYGELYSSSYSNQESVVYGAGLIEYNIFPYSESTRRLLCIRYRQGIQYMDYLEETIYDHHNQWLHSGKVTLVADIKRTWGSIYGSLAGSAYYYDMRKNRLSLYTQLSLRIIKGLSFNVSSNASRVRDQITLPKTDLSREDILLRIREMATSYDYYVSLGISYTFGSIYNNIVNVRLSN